MLILNWKRISHHRNVKAAEAAFTELVNNDYDWCAYLEDADFEYFVHPSNLDYSIVQLDEDQLPVLFLTTPDYSYEAAGRSRIIIYDQEARECREIWGVINRVVVTGYIPSDDDHEYPIIFCSGIHQDVMNEYIYEYHGGDELVLIAERHDIWPYCSDRADVYSVDDEYIWRDQEVGIAEYYLLLGEIYEGYRDIEWTVRHPTTTYVSIEYVNSQETEN